MSEMGPYGVVYDPVNRMYYLLRPDGTRTIFGKRLIAEHAARECNHAHAAAIASKPTTACDKLRVALEEIADTENPEHYGNARDALHAVKLKAREVLDELDAALADAGKEGAS